MKVIGKEKTYEIELDLDAKLSLGGKEVTLDMDKLTEMDASGMHTLKEMYRNAIHSNNIFFIVGSGCKEVYEDFKYPNVA